MEWQQKREFRLEISDHIKWEWQRIRWRDGTIHLDKTEHIWAENI